MQLTAFGYKQQFIFMCFVVKQIACLFVCLFFHTDSQINGKVPLFTRPGFIHENAITASQTLGRARWGGPFSEGESVPHSALQLWKESG